MFPGQNMFLIIILCLFGISRSYLLFPKLSVLQITMSISTPVFVPNQKMYFDWGFQMNYDLPANLSSFYSVPIWPGAFNKRLSRDIDHSKYQVLNEGVHSNDFTAGELYIGFEDLLLSYGFHETCLLKSVCELAKHPFHDDEQNLITEIVTFILSPSMHQAFGKNEHVYKEAYEEAENQGFLNGNCDKLYPHCKQGFLEIISNIITDKDALH
ncbi:uncharacterized protein LOC129952065 [Eupeodes corollae]|uniref:uncharacterized protein LOC129952065 n=1 Tax=Eupeodes corollae TaxID=290404 RepID=UPI002491193F|nr:uncharacterized protein LOC129952065 [Eupeodes corollae]XP_055920465.1 uncharacterized protein LOC129952065 [Eupeodes corollae]